MIKQQNTKRKRNQSHNLQFTWTVTSLSILFKGNDHSNDRQSSKGFEKIKWRCRVRLHAKMAVPSCPHQQPLSLS